MVVVCKGGERGLGLPGHVGVGVAKPILVHLHDAVRRQIQVLARLSAVGQLVLDEAEHKPTVDAFLNSGLFGWIWNANRESYESSIATSDRATESCIELDTCWISAPIRLISEYRRVGRAA